MGTHHYTNTTIPRSRPVIHVKVPPIPTVPETIFTHSCPYSWWRHTVFFVWLWRKSAVTISPQYTSSKISEIFHMIFIHDDMNSSLHAFYFVDKFPFPSWFCTRKLLLLYNRLIVHESDAKSNFSIRKTFFCKRLWAIFCITGRIVHVNVNHNNFIYWPNSAVYTTFFLLGSYW